MKAMSMTGMANAIWNVRLVMHEALRRKWSQGPGNPVDLKRNEMFAKKKTFL